MAAKLTPLAKTLMTFAILGAAGAAAWHLGLKEKFEAQKNSETTAQTESEKGAPFAGFSKNEGALGTSNNPLKVSIVSFHGYAPVLLSNGKSLKTQSGSTYANMNLNLELVIQDDIPTLTTIFESKSAHCAWRTSDFWAQEQPNLRNAGLDAKAVMIVDNTQGADAIISRDPNIRTVEDLAGKKIALLQYTPSDGMVIDAIDNSALSARKKESVKFVYINADEGTAGVRAAFIGGQVDAAALWDPDLSLALKAVKGAKVIYSTKTATNLIYDVIVCDQRVLNDPQNEVVIQKFVEGWLDSVNKARTTPDEAVDALVKTEQFFELLEREQGRDFIKDLFGNLVWTNLEDNIRILGLSGSTNHYARVYRRFDQIYRKAGALANPNSPVINAEDSFDLRFVKKLMEKDQAAIAAAKKPQFEFSEGERTQAEKRPAALTKPVTVNFDTGSAELSKRSQRTIDEEMVPLIENNGSAYFVVSGNTDSTGSKKFNLELSKNRAKAVVDYLVKEWEFKSTRFKIVGNGPDAPLCLEKDASIEGLSLDECRARNRTTRVAVLSR